MTGSTASIAAAAVGIACVGTLGCGNGLPTGLYHFLHLAIPPKDLYEPIMTDGYFFDSAGAERSYRLSHRYHDYYELGIRSRTGALPADYRFVGRLQAEFVADAETVMSMEASSIRSGVFAKDEPGRYAHVGLLRFVLPVRRGVDTSELRLRVLDPDVISAGAREDLEIYVAVSGTP